MEIKTKKELKNLADGTIIQDKIGLKFEKHSDGIACLNWLDGFFLKWKAIDDVMCRNMKYAVADGK